MAINYIIKSDVIDIRNDIPKPDDVFLVDSNVWFWLTYTRASLSNPPPHSHQINDYPSYIGRAISAKTQLYSCGLSFAELAHLIERAEREIYIRAHGNVSSKEFRHNYSSERSNVVTEIQTAWSQVKTMAQTVELQINQTATDAALARLSAHPLDGYDLFILESIFSAGIVKVITDDGDYVTVPGIQVFTANPNVITAAKNQEKLSVR